MNRNAWPVPAAIAAALLAAAGAQAGGYNRPAAPKYSEERVAAALGLRRPDGHAAWHDDKQACVASRILLTRKDIKTYADAGDSVVTNPSGTVGVKVGAFAGVDKRMCFDRFEAALAKLP